MPGTLVGCKIAVLATDGVEQVELTEPVKALKEAGEEAELISTHKGEGEGLNHLAKGKTITVDRTETEVSETDYRAIVVTGGLATR